MNEGKTLRYSRQREMILEYLKGTDAHPSADVVYENIRKDIPSISLGTVYRNLQMLSEQGIINKIQSGAGPDRFDGDMKVHSHFHCEKCGRIYDIEEKSSGPLPDSEHHITGRDTIYRGICSNCNQ